MNLEEIRRKSSQYIWHPYTSMPSFSETEFPVIEKASGVYLYEKDGKKLFDGISSWWCVNLGHSHPALIEAMRSQSEKLQHSILGGASHPKAVELSEKIVEITPSGLDHVFYAGDGSCAVEAALKISIQYWKNIGVENKTRFISLAEGYHGDTLGAVGVGYVDLFHKNFKDNIIKSHTAMSPHCAMCPFNKHPGSCEIECFDSMKELIELHYKETAAVVCEPLCQGAAGIRIYPEKYLKLLREECDKYNLLLIADEIAVGFGRTGEWFACNKAEVTPDIMTIGKGLTGGYLPMSAAVVSNYIFDSFKPDDDNLKILYHGHTFCGNPITSALASKAIDIYREENVFAGIPEKSKTLKEGLEKAAELLSGSFMQALGMIGAIEINDNAGGLKRAEEIAVEARRNGLFIRPLGKVIYLWPPLVTADDELKEIINILLDSCK
ncbi:MAG: adenosylmethionine--8-amino-7-oxononanoate transaminase [Planctomycetota bacterium]|jgi:adenosylmethionine-8-amino-7-oxononanoate aminotransferase